MIPRWTLAAAASAALATACGAGARAPAPSTPPAGAGQATAPPPAPEPEPEPPGDPVPTAVEASVKLYEAIAALPATRSCRETAAAIDTLVQARLASIATVRDAARGDRGAEIDALFGAASARLGAASATIDGLVARCSGEPAVATAIGRISGAEARR